MEKLKRGYIWSVPIIIFTFIELTAYQFMNIKKYWTFIPMILYVAFKLWNILIRKNSNKNYILEKISLGSILFFLIVIKVSIIYHFFINYFMCISLIIFIMFLTSLIVKSSCLKNEDKENTSEKYLFNLFYLNTSKTHEIAMLIDNKIMKTIEQEQAFERTFKRGLSGKIQKKDRFEGSSEMLIEDNSKQKVYENFDVKMTKSIMLRKIYETAMNNKNKSFQEGDLVLFKDIELKQRNVDDTVMILDILQDSKFKNQGNEDLEININKMMDKMLDDFTIDYTFSNSKRNKEEKKYIIQLPYKATDNFENGYHHNDLQLGKLSLIGIYRGTINFSERESVSSKFLDLMSESMQDSNSQIQKEQEMVLSDYGEQENKFKFNFTRQKLKETLELIDVIAIIQEININ